MAYFLHQADVDAARSVANRAIKTILFREEVWPMIHSLVACLACRRSSPGSSSRVVHAVAPVGITGGENERVGGAHECGA